MQAGPNQTGFSAQEDAALNTNAIDTTGAAAANVERTIGNETAGRNDSGNLPESGVDQGLKENAASAAAGQTASEELGITEADYATGRANFNAATSAEEGVAGQYGSGASSTMSGANEANKNAFGEESEITQQQDQEEADIAGGVTSLAEAGLTGGMSLAAGGLSGFTGSGADGSGGTAGFFDSLGPQYGGAG
jgi:hypothetical protein